MHDHNDEAGQSRLHEKVRRHHERVHEALDERHAHRRGRGRDRYAGHHHGGGRWEGRRANRGDVRAAVLALLTEEPMHGYQIIQELTERSGGAWTPSPGSIYPALQMLQDEGLVNAVEADGKRVFTLTATGRKEADARGEAPLPWEAAAHGEGNDLIELRRLVGSTGAAVKQVAMAGDDAQIAKAIELLRATRRDLYRLLAEDDSE
jgi:DNA-binding PadR family transcriptional regulator